MKYDITVVGSCSIDNIYYAKKDNTYNSRPDLIVPGGKGSNQAVAASRAGSKVNIISIISNNKEGLLLKENLDKNNINTSNIELVDVDNDINNIYINYYNKDNSIKREINTSKLITIDFIKRHLSSILESKMVLIQTKIPKSTTEYIINICYKNNIKVIVTPSNPKELDITLIDKITYITANKKECLSIFNEDIKTSIKKYPNKLIVTLGSKGVIFSNKNKIIEYNSIKVDNIKDTIGAGDTFTGNLAVLLLENKPLEAAINIAQYASALKILKKSPQEGMPFKKERDLFIKVFKQ